jgi:predicted transcriptional regulator
MLFQRHILDGIAVGDITCAFRLWRKPTVRNGGTLKTAIGVLRITGLDVIAASDISDRDARRAGHASAEEVRRALHADRGGTLYRISFRRDGPDPRIRLRGDDKLGADALADIEKRLGRLDRRESGPWTLDYLELIADNPGVLSTKLAKRVNVERDVFKRDVRKLKEMGLTESLEIGYRISPRGRAVLKHLSRRSTAKTGR